MLDFLPDDRPSEQSNVLLIINLQYVTAFINTFLVSTLRCMLMICKAIKFFFFFFLIKMLIAVLFFNAFNSSSCISPCLRSDHEVSALILGSASSWACTLVFPHDVDSKACLTALLWCCDSVRFWLWSWGPVALLLSHSFSFFFHAIYISLFLRSYCPSGLGSLSPLFFVSELLQLCRLQSYFGALV